ncbi:MAG: hypothetical protein ACR2HB_11295 [Dehalococcoidia bacterium]
MPLLERHVVAELLEDLDVIGEQIEIYSPRTSEDHRRSNRLDRVHSDSTYVIVVNVD